MANTQVMNDVERRAYRANIRYQAQRGCVYQEPETVLEVQRDGGSLVLLSNVTGIVATYRITQSGRLRRLDDSAGRVRMEDAVS